MRKTVVKELKFSGVAADARTHPDIDEKHKFIALIDGQYFIGHMNKVWFGWSFDDGWGNCGHQFDPPGTNGCRWQKVWRVEKANGLRAAESILLAAGLDPVKIRKNDELRYAVARRRYSIDHGMVFKRKKITEDSPIEAWLYPGHAKGPMMPGPYDDVEEE